MRLRPHSLACLLPSALCLLVPAAAAARPAPITGTLAKPGYTIIALSYDGRSVAVPAKGAFRLVPPAKKVTLHLRAPSGKYAGPIVVGRKGRVAILGVRAGTKLGVLKVSASVVRPAKRLPAKALDAARVATARKGVPIGAGVYGRVKAAAKGVAGEGSDQDRDGIPGAFDVDDDGDLVLDNMERSSGARMAQAGPGGTEKERFSLFSNFHLAFEDAINANAGGVTDATIDAVMTSSPHWAGLALQVPDGDDVELDCGGLVYCSAGGTGRILEPYPEGLAFPACCDADGDGMGTLENSSDGFQLLTRAPASKIGSGDTFVEHIGDRQLVGILNYMFNTTPAVHAYTDGSGTGGLISYPVAADGPFTQRHPTALHPDASGNLTLSFTFWRPQRRAIPGSGEGDGFVDIGGLGYHVNIPNGPHSVPNPSSTPAPPTSGPESCPASSFTTADPSLAPDPPMGFHDTAGDRPADPANLLTVTLNVTACLATVGQALEPGQTLGFEIQAISSVGDNANQGMFVCRPNAGEADCPVEGPPPPGPPGPPVP